MMKYTNTKFSYLTSQLLTKISGKKNYIYNYSDCYDFSRMKMYQCNCGYKTARAHRAAGSMYLINVCRNKRPKQILELHSSSFM
jgi:hypothetical protein